jgi:hypothetical protein
MTSTEPQTAALAILDLAQAGQLAEIRERFAVGLRPMVTAEALKAAWDAEVAQLGLMTSIGTPTSEQADAETVHVKVPVRFESGDLTLLASVIATGELAGLQLVPADGPRAAGAVAAAALGEPRPLYGAGTQPRGWTAGRARNAHPAQDGRPAHCGSHPPLTRTGWSGANSGMVRAGDREGGGAGGELGEVLVGPARPHTGGALVEPGQADAVHLGEVMLAVEYGVGEAGAVSRSRPSRSYNSGPWLWPTANRQA